MALKVTEEIVAGLKTINSECRKIKELVEGEQPVSPDLEKLKRKIKRQVYMIGDIDRHGEVVTDEATIKDLVELFKLCKGAFRQMEAEESMEMWVKAMGDRDAK